MHFDFKVMLFGCFLVIFTGTGDLGNVIVPKIGAFWLQSRVVPVSNPFNLCFLCLHCLLSLPVSPNALEICICLCLSTLKPTPSLTHISQKMHSHLETNGYSKPTMLKFWHHNKCWQKKPSFLGWILAPVHSPDFLIEAVLLNFDKFWNI